ICIRCVLNIFCTYIISSFFFLFKVHFLLFDFRLIFRCCIFTYNVFIIRLIRIVIIFRWLLSSIFIFIVGGLLILLFSVFFWFFFFCFFFIFVFVIFIVIIRICY